MLDSGKLTEYGSASNCIHKYLSDKPKNHKSILDHISKRDNCFQIESVTVNGSPDDYLEISSGLRILKIEFSGRISKSVRFEIEARIHDLYDNALAFFSPGHKKGSAHLYAPGPFKIVRYVEIPDVMRGEYILSLYLTTPDIMGWLDIPRAVRLSFEGTPTSTGRVFDYDKGRGWIFLSEISTNEETR